MRQRFRERGYTLATALMVLMLMTIMGITQMESHRINMITAGRERDYMDNYFCTESALNLGFDWLRNRGRRVLGNGPNLDQPIDVTTASTLVPDPVVLDPITDPAQNGYCAPRYPSSTPSATGGTCDGRQGTMIVVDPADVQNRTGTTYELRATSHHRQRPEDAMTLVYRFTVENFAKFAYFTEEERPPGLNATIRFGPDDGLNGGRVHTNDQNNGFLIEGAEFYGPVTQVCLSGCQPRTGTFLGGFQAGVSSLPLPTRDDMMRTISVSQDTAQGLSRMTRLDAELYADTDAAIVAGAGMETSNFWGNTWIRMNDCSDHWWDPITVQPQQVLSIGIDLGTLTTRSQLVSVADLDTLGVNPLDRVRVWGGGSPNFNGWIFDLGTGYNFLENALIGNLAEVSWPGGSETYVVVSNDRNNVVLADHGTAPPPDTALTIRLQCPGLTIFNAHYNTNTTIPGDGNWGTTQNLSIAELVNGIAMAVNGGPGHNSYILDRRYALNDGPLSANFDLVYGPTVYGINSAVDSRVNNLIGIDNDEALELISIGGDPNGSVSATRQGQGPAAGVSWTGGPARGVIGVMDPCSPYNPQHDFDNCPADIRNYSRITSSRNWGEASSDVRVWGMHSGALTIATMRDIFLATNRSQLPLWHSDHQVLLTEHDFNDVVLASVTGDSSWQSIAAIHGPGFLPINDGVPGAGGMGDAQCAYPGDPFCLGLNDQSKNLYGVAYQNNPDPDDAGFMTCNAHLKSNECCRDEGYYSLLDGCTDGPVLWPDREYKGDCTGDILGLFAFQNVMIEDPSPRSDETDGGLDHQPAFDVAIEAVIIGLNSSWGIEHIYGRNYPLLGNWENDQTNNRYPPNNQTVDAFDVHDRDNYERYSGGNAQEIGPMGHMRTLGGIIQKFRGIVGYGYRGYLKDYKYDNCIKLTGAPPYTPEVRADNPIIAFKTLASPCQIMVNSM